MNREEAIIAKNDLLDDLTKSNVVSEQDVEAGKICIKALDLFFSLLIQGAYK